MTQQKSQQVCFKYFELSTANLSVVYIGKKLKTITTTGRLEPDIDHSKSSLAQLVEQLFAFANV
jgi:hypothetical protein